MAARRNIRVVLGAAAIAAGIVVTMHLRTTVAMQQPQMTAVAAAVLPAPATRPARAKRLDGGFRIEGLPAELGVGADSRSIFDVPLDPRDVGASFPFNDDWFFEPDAATLESMRQVPSSRP